MMAKWQQQVEEYSFRAYLTDALRMQGENKYPADRWCDLIKPQKPVKEDPRDCNEIVADMWKRIKG